MDCESFDVIVGLTGLIGSGKTTVANCFAKLGVDIIDTDQIAHQITMPGSSVLGLLALEFGQEIINQDGSLNRDLLRKIVFDNRSERLKLESILHPKIFEQAMNELKQANSKYQMLVVPLLFKSPKYLEVVDKTLFVDSDYQLLLERLWLRNGFDKETVDTILHAQVSRNEQVLMADSVIINNGNMEELEKQVFTLHQEYLKV